MGTMVDISEYSDFCFGVKRAISLAEKALKKCPAPVFSLGPLIHNRQVVTRLSGKGLSIVKDLKNITRGTIVIRSHGVSANTLDRIKRKKLNIVDATCPFVKNAQRIAKKLSESGYKVIIIGDKGHPEVKALRSFSKNGAVVIAAKNEIRNTGLKMGKIGIVAQTTQLPENFLEVMTELLKKEFNEIRIFNTICRDTSMRQEAAKQCSKNNGLVIVVGGKNSANTRRLYDICRRMGTRAYHVEGPADIKSKWLKSEKAVGIVSGASTPRWIVDDVVARLKNM